MKGRGEGKEMGSGGEWAAACVDHSAIHPACPLGSESGASSE